ncbi:MAG: hypothetical protein RIS64_3267 [Bacteroidota bacterium]|jgi:hypothetical protein
MYLFIQNNAKFKSKFLIDYQLFTIDNNLNSKKMF